MPFRTAIAVEADAALRGVYCLREPVDGLWAYYNWTSTGRLLTGPVPCEVGEHAAFVISTLWDELDDVDPEPPTLTVSYSADAGTSSPSRSTGRLPLALLR